MKKLWQPDIALVCLRAIAKEKVGRNRVLDDIHHPGSAEGNTMLFPEYGDEPKYRLHHPFKRGIVTHNAGHFTFKATQL